MDLENPYAGGAGIGLVFASGGIGNVGFGESLCRAAIFDWFMGEIDIGNGHRIVFLCFWKEDV